MLEGHTALFMPSLTVVNIVKNTRIVTDTEQGNFCPIDERAYKTQGKTIVHAKCGSPYAYAK
jgi:hypothetical protein